MTPVGFEPTQLALVELESTPLDHSGKVSHACSSIDMDLRCEACSNQDTQPKSQQDMCTGACRQLSKTSRARSKRWRQSAQQAVAVGGGAQGVTHDRDMYLHIQHCHTHRSQVPLPLHIVIIIIIITIDDVEK